MPIALNFVTAGTSGNPAIVFIHGNSSDAATWDMQLAETQLTNKYYLIAIDLPGHGLSPRNNDYSMSAVVQIVKDNIAALNLSEFILVGHSLGTCIIGEIAHLLPGCKGVVLESSNLTNNEFNPTVYIQPLPALAAMTLEAAPENLLCDFVDALVFNNQYGTKEAYKLSYTNTDPAYRTALLQSIIKGDWTDEFANVLTLKAPVCIVFGEEEKAINVHYMDTFPSKWMDKIHRVPGAGHFVHNEQPQLFNALLLE
jgi:pimeloyl-ACP methyl ester carboxylesterase